MMIPVKTNTSSQRMLLQTIRSVSEMHLFGKIVLYSNLVQCQSCLGPFKAAIIHIPLCTQRDVSSGAILS